MVRWLHKHGLHLATKLLVWSLVMSVLLASLPIPIAVVSHDAAEDNTPYPCRDGKCGCKSAFQCWTSCCCHSAQERLDWAAKNGVVVPEYGQHLKRIVAEQRASQSAKPACCQKPKPAAAVAKAACCQTKVPAVAVARASCCEVKAKTEVATAKPRTKIVLSMFALGCRGSSGELVSLPWAIVHASVSDSWVLGPLEFALAVVNVQGPSRFYPPELPPPRLS